MKENAGRYKRPALTFSCHYWPTGLRGFFLRPFLSRSKFPARVFLGELAVIKLRISAARSEQRTMIALLDDRTVLHDQNEIRVANR